MVSYINSTGHTYQRRITSRLNLSGLLLQAMLVALLLAAATVVRGAGNLDRTFGTKGKAVTPIGTGHDKGFDVVVQPDGKLVVAGVSSATASANFNTTLARYNADGTLDQTFGLGGKAIVDLSLFGEGASAVALQSDGKIVVVGYISNGTDANFVVTRFNADGTLDTTFGANGSANTPIGAAGVTEVANDVAIQTVNGEEKIVAVGSTNVTGGSDYAVVRYNANGTLDETFDTDGIVVTSIFSSLDNAQGVTIEPISNKIVVAGSSRFDAGGGSFNDDISVVRYNTNGMLDTTFDTDGKVTTNISAIDAARDVVIQQIDNQIKIVVGGISTRNSFLDFTLVRYNANGAVDTTFGTNGRAITAIANHEDQIHALALQPDNKIVAAGFTRTGTNGVNEDFALARYNANGSLDTSFGSCGKIITPIAGGNGVDLAWGVGLQQDGKVVVAGYTQTGVSTSLNEDFAVLRYLPNGSAASPASVDFDGDGKTDISVFRPSTGYWYQNCSCATPKNVQFGSADDKLVAADYDGDGKTDVAVFRNGVWYISNSLNSTVSVQQFGTADDLPVTGDFDNDGHADLAVFRPSNGHWYVSQSSNGELLVVELGAEGDVPVPADFNDDGKTDFAVFRPSNGTWYTSPDPASNYGAVQFGQAGDVPVTGDYDGDGKADLAVFRPADGTWYLLQTTAGYRFVQFGLSTDVPVTGDYDGDGKNDVAVFRNGTWHILQSSTGTLRSAQWGAAGDVPVPVR